MKRNTLTKSFMTIFLSCLSLIILMNMTFKIDKTHASAVAENTYYANETDDLSAFTNSEATYSINSYTNPNDLDGKRIINHEKIYSASLYPEHDEKNGCGIVAMSILVKFYNELDTVYQGEFIPNESMNYNETYLYHPVPQHRPADYDQHQARANALRDDITERTPKAFGGLFGAENMTLPNSQKTGLTKYLNYHSPNIQRGIYYSESLFQSYDITSILDKNVPVLLTLMNYNFYKEDGDFKSAAGRYHVVVAYGYRYINN